VLQKLQKLEHGGGNEDVSEARRDYYRYVKGCVEDVDMAHHPTRDDKGTTRVGFNKLEITEGLILPVSKTEALLL
jgi:hypothetical protein